jgi:hypothetical protein
MNLTKRQLGTIILLLVCASYAFQNRRTTPRPIPTDYSKFSHRTKQHQAACDSCHKVPSRGWQKASTFPDITDYPGHDACVSCHRAQFFKSARPVICSVCHPKTSPREEARYQFRNPATKLQFTIDFPHDRHQDVIATRQELRTQRVAHHAGPFTDNPQSYNNCTICHGQQQVPTGVTWPDSYVPRTETFKSAPTSHGSCFNCHWKNQEPVATNCNGCHKLAPSPFFSVAPKRISLKFMHEGGGEKKVHVAECTTCHINITRSASLRGLKADVPITACSECHNREGLRQDVSKELIAIDKNKAFVCIYCHTSEIGSLDPPASHYLIAERPPLKRKEIK